MAAFGVDVLSPAVTPRRAWVLLHNLPPQFRGPGEVWTPEAELLAVLVDQLAVLTWVTLKAHGAKNVPRPRPLPRPSSRPSASQGRPGPGPGPAGPGQVKAGSWAEAAQLLSSIPGVVTDGLRCPHHPGDS